MKVCIVTDYLPKYHKLWSGAELIAVTLGQMLRSSGCEVFFLTTPWDFPHADNHTTIYPVNTLAKRLGALARNFPIDILAFRDICRRLRETRPDVVHINAKYLFLPTVRACLRLKIPVVFTVPDYFIFCPTTFIRRPDGSSCTAYHGARCCDCLDILSNGPVKKLVRYVPKFILKTLLALRARQFNRLLPKLSAYVTLTNISRNRLVEYGIPGEKIRVIYHYKLASPGPTDVKVVRPAAVFAGWLSEENGTDILVEAFARTAKTVGRANLYLIGTGAGWFEDKIKRRIADCGITDRVIFLGKKENPEVLSIISQCDVVVVPHQWPKEFGPVILLEALAMGKPVVTSRIGATEEFVEDGENGLLVSDYNRPEAFAEKLTVLLSSPDIAKRMGEKGGKSLAFLKDDSTAREMIELYQMLVARQTASS
ncbi:MAG: glycosyltransferase family 4 protein [Planctomycetota bacterium]